MVQLRTAMLKRVNHVNKIREEARIRNQYNQVPLQYNNAAVTDQHHKEETQ